MTQLEKEILMYTQDNEDGKVSDSQTLAKIRQAYKRANRRRANAT